MMMTAGLKIEKSAAGGSECCGIICELEILMGIIVIYRERFFFFEHRLFRKHVKM